MIHAKEKRETLLARCLVLLLSCALVLLGLYAVNATLPRAAQEDGLYRLSEEQLTRDVWLLSDSTGERAAQKQLRVELGGDTLCYLYTASAETLRLLRANGHPLDYFLIGRTSVAVLPPEERSFTLDYQEAQGNPLQLNSNPIYLGSREQVIHKIGQDQSYLSILQGFFMFSVVFALTMYMLKRSETYLLFYAAHATIPLIMFQYPFWKSAILAGSGLLVAALGALTAPRPAALLQYAYVFLNALIHWLIYREFAEDRIGGRPYPAYLASLYVLLSVLALIRPGIFGSATAFYFFYFVMYLLEGIMLLQNPIKEGEELFSLILIAGWAVSLTFWLARTANNLGLLSYPFSIGSHVAFGYTFSFLICINGKFARKYQQADQLLVETRLLNESLEKKVVSRTKDLQQALEDLEKAQQNKNQFMANIIHNLKTPLFSLKGYAELLQESLPEAGSEEREYLGTICRNVDYVQEMIQQLLLFDRLEEKKIQFHFVEISLAAFLEKLRDTERVSLQAKDLSFSLCNRLPPEFVFEGDELYLSQAAINILDNAIRHSFPGGAVELCAEAAPAEENGEGCLRLTIRDHGEGMREEVKSHIFERCYSHHENGEKSSGLGLNIAQEIVREHHGSIQVSSEYGKGSSFVISLPLTK